MKNIKVTLINQLNHILKKNGINTKIVSVEEIPHQTFEVYDDFAGDIYIDETNPEMIVTLSNKIAIVSRRYLMDYAKLQYKWNKKYGIDISISMITP